MALNAYELRLNRSLTVWINFPCNMWSLKWSLSISNVCLVIIADMKTGLDWCTQSASGTGLMYKLNSVTWVWDELDLLRINPSLRWARFFWRYWVLDEPWFLAKEEELVPWGFEMSVGWTHLSASRMIPLGIWVYCYCQVELEQHNMLMKHMCTT